MVLNIGLAQSHNYDNNHKITYHYYYDYSVSNRKRLKKWAIHAIINVFIISVSFYFFLEKYKYLLFDSTKNKIDNIDKY